MLLRIYQILNYLYFSKSTRYEDSENICKVFEKWRLSKLGFCDSGQVERKIQKSEYLLQQVFVILHQSQQV
jgi:hypothetical protein